MQVIDDEGAEVVIAPAPPPEAFSPKSQQPKPARQPYYARIEFRRTIIPILLTSGVTLAVLGGGYFLIDPDSPLRNVQWWIPVTLLLISPLLLALAVLNMLHVKHDLERPGRGTGKDASRK